MKANTIKRECNRGAALGRAVEWLNDFFQAKSFGQDQ